MEKNKSSQKTSVLGKGLASLLPASATTSPKENPGSAESSVPQDSNKDRHPGISMCGIDEIVENTFQPRKTFHDETLEELAQSIKANGLIQPLIVRKATLGYQLIAGERRLRAAKKAGLKQVPIVIRRTTDKEALELALVENLQREDLNCVESALAYAQLMQEFNLKQEELAEKMGKDRTSIANHLRLLKLPQRVQTVLKDNLLTFGHGKALASLENPIWIEKLSQQAIDEKWSVRELENQVQRIKNLQNLHSAASKNLPQDPVQTRLKTLSRDLTKKMSTKVQIKGDSNKGKFIIEYFSNEDLERVLDVMLNSKV